jgi:hypothetical protein
MARWPTEVPVPGGDAACSRGLSGATPPDESTHQKEPRRGSSGGGRLGAVGVSRVRCFGWTRMLGREWISRGAGLAGTPPGFRIFLVGGPVVSLRSTTGYMLESLRDEWGRWSGGPVVSLRSTTGYRLGIPPGLRGIGGPVVSSRSTSGCRLESLRDGEGTCGR